MLVKLDHLPRDRGKNKKCLKPPPSLVEKKNNCQILIPETSTEAAIRQKLPSAEAQRGALAAGEPLLENGPVKRWAIPCTSRCETSN